MRNMILLMVFFLINGVMFIHYFMPNIDRENNADQIENVLLNVKKTVPVTSKIYFLTQRNFQEAPEIYYKTQFSLAPRVVIAEKYENVPRGSYMLELRQKMNSSEAVMIYPVSDYMFTERDEFFEATLLKKAL